jgi:hypothetical protein
MKKVFLNSPLVFLLLLPATLRAQQTADVEASGGVFVFTDESEPFVGGAARFYVSPRVSLGPEVNYIFGNSHSHLVLTGNLMFDFLSQRRLTPFVVAGGGIFHTRSDFAFPNSTSRHTEGAFTAGGGIRTLLGNRITVGADLRVGWETHVRLSGMVGVRLGR